MKKLLLIGLLAFVACENTGNRQKSFCTNLVNQRANAIVNLSNHDEPTRAIIVAQTDSMYIKCGCDTIK